MPIDHACKIYLPSPITFSLFADEQYMGNILHSTALLLIFYWVLGYYAFGAGAFIHILLAMAVMIIALRVVIGNRAIIE
jgi:hypothetical protein